MYNRDLLMCGIYNINIIYYGSIKRGIYKTSLFVF